MGILFPFENCDTAEERATPERGWVRKEQVWAEDQDPNQSGHIQQEGAEQIMGGFSHQTQGRTCLGLSLFLVKLETYKFHQLIHPL